jgi:hypothetical protein
VRLPAPILSRTARSGHVLFASCSSSGAAIEVEEAPVEAEDSTLAVRDSTGRRRDRRAHRMSRRIHLVGLHSGSGAKRIIAMARRSHP